MSAPEQWQQVEQLYRAVAGLSPAEREAVLSAVDKDVRRQVEQLLQDGPTETLTMVNPPASGPAFERRQVGPYTIEASIGAGGMGEVFRAIDTRLNRPVAIKFCEPRFIARFEREARAISALNHPHICTLYDVGPNYLVMELIEGHTLSSRIRQGPLPFEDVVRYGEEIAEALAEAHAAGIIHRDLKPGNVMLGKHGVKVLDFGLAKMASDSGDALTRANAVMGTPAYMAPEQVKGKPADARTDLFALGLILHEMSTGKLPFPGASLGTMLAADASTVVPQPSKVRAAFPSKLDTLVANLLAADPSRRPANAAGVRDQLRLLAAPKGRSKPVGLATAATAVLALGAGLWWQFARPTSVPLQVESLKQIAAFPGDKLDPAFSPDGSMLAFSWHGEKGDAPGIYVMPAAGSMQPRRLTQPTTDDVSPAWGPKGRRIAFLRLRPGQPSEAMLISADGGTEQRVRDVSMPEYLRRERPLVAWTPDGNGLVMPMDDLESGGASLYRMSLDGSHETRLVRAQSGLGVTSPALSADGHWLAYQQSDPPRLYAQRLVDQVPQGEPQIVIDKFRGASPVWAPTGDALWFIVGSRILAWNSATNTNQTVYTSPSPLQALAAVWESASVIPRVVFSIAGGQFDFDSLELADGGHRVAGQAHVALANAFDASFSPDGRWLVFSSDVTGNQELWIAMANGERRRQVTHQGFFVVSEPKFSPDGKHIAFHGRKPTIAQIYVVDVDPESELSKPETVVSNLPARQITHSEFSLLGPLWSPDSKYFYATTTKGARTVRVPASGEGAEELFESSSERIDPTGIRVYYGKPDKVGLYTRSLEGDVRSNPEERILSDFTGLQVHYVAKTGIFYQGSDATGKWVAIRFYDFALRKSFDIAPPSRDAFPHFAASPDGRHLLFSTVSDAPGSLTLMQLKAGN